MSYISDVASVIKATNKSELHITPDNISFIDHSMLNMSHMGDSESEGNIDEQLL